MHRRSILMLASVVLSAAVALALTGCASDPENADPTDPSSSAESSAPAETPSADPTEAAPAVTIPTDCHDLVSAATYTSTFGATPLNDPAFGDVDPSGVVTPITPDAGATPEEILAGATQLDCLWADPQADITQLRTTVGTVDSAIATQFFSGLPADGYACEQKYDGQWCQKVVPNAQYPVDEGHTHFLRDSVYISVLQINFPTNGYLAEVVSSIWP